MELDKRVVEYASLILNNANILLNENNNLSPRQRKCFELIVIGANMFIEVYNQFVSALATEVVPHEQRRLERDMAHELGCACSIIITRCYLAEKVDSTLNWTESHKSILVNIEQFASLIWAERCRLVDYLIATAKLS